MIELLASVGAVLTLAIWALLAERRAGQQQARGDAMAVRYEAMTAANNALAHAAKRQEERANGLDALLDEMAAMDDPAAARAHVLSRRARQDADADGDPGAVPGGEPDPAVAGGSDDALLKPGE